jgi:hypothetical protein
MKTFLCVFDKTMRYGMAWLRSQYTFMQAAQQVNANNKRERRNESPAQSAWSEAIYLKNSDLRKAVASKL